MTPQPLTDSQIRAAFQARSAGSASPDLAERIQAAARTTGQQRRLVVLPGGLGVQPQRLLWAAAISATSLALVGGLLIVGDQNDDQISVVPSPVPSERPSLVPEPTSSAPASEAPSPSVEPTPTAAPSTAVDPELLFEHGAVTVVGDLRVRSLPTVDESSDRLEPLLPAGMRLLIIGGSVFADGYAWYRVMPFDGTYPSGWVAAGSRDGEPWIAADTTECPPAPFDTAELAALGTFGGLICSPSEGLSFGVDGELTCDFADVDRSITGPSWLRHDRYCEIDLGESTLEIFDDGMNIEYGPGRVNGHVIGHFADRDSNTCVYALDEQPAPDPLEVVETCRAMFVATEWESVPID